MRNRQNVLLVGIATMALLVGTGLVSAQDAARNQGGAAPKGAVPSASTQSGKGNNIGSSAVQDNGKSGESTLSGKPSGQTARDEKSQAPSTAQKDMGQNKPDAHRSAQEINRGGKTDEGRSAQRQDRRNPATAQETNQSRRSIAAGEHRGRDRTQNTARTERQNGLEGLHADTTKPMQGADVHLNDHQRTTIRKSVIDARGAPRVDRVNFDVRVGTVVPRQDIHVVPVPETLVRIEPEWRGFLYFVHEDEVVVVNPRDMRIVAVLTV